LSKEQHKKLLIVIGGPTASGKTSIAIKIAKIIGAEIISADSRQVYKEMSIGTAKPDVDEMSGIKHHFISNISIHDEYNVGKYEKEVISFLKDYFKKNDIAILVGGTGLYINAVLTGLDKFPTVDSKIIEELNISFQEKGIEYLQKELKRLDPDYYDKVDLENPHRLIRALSVFYSAQNPFSY
jgi:tRNA dimethylallyltransferase